LSTLTPSTQIVTADEQIFEICRSLSEFSWIADDLVEYIKEYINQNLHVTDSGDFTIRSIENIRNIGQIDQKQTIEFIKNGLNVFYGKNGTGKTTVYKSLISGFVKKENYKLISRDNDESLEKEIVINYTDHQSNKEFQYQYSEETKTNFSVQIFDSKVSLFLIENALENNFSFSHLRTEAFEIAKIFIAEREEELKGKLKSLRGELNKLQTDLGDKSLKSDIDSLKIYIANYQNQTLMPLSETSKIDDYISQRAKLNTSDYEKELEVLKNLLKDLQILSELLRNPITKNILFTEDFFQKENDCIQREIIEKEAIKNDDPKILLSQIPPNWFESSFWRYHVYYAIQFINSEKIETCPLCLKDIDDEETTELFAKYKSAVNHHSFSPPPKVTGSMTVESVGLSQSKKILNHLDTSQNLNLIVLMNSFSSEIGICYKKVLESLRFLCNGIMGSHEKLITISYSKEVVENFSNIVSAVDELIENINSQIQVIDTLLIDKQKSITNLNAKIEKINHDKSILESIEVIRKCVDIYNEISENTSKLDSIPKLKQRISAKQTNFSENEIMTEFRSHLKKQYDDLGFHDHSEDLLKNLKSKTNDGITKRHYQYHNTSIKEILSEGEMKIQSLADFLAESKLRNKRNVYVFDDPVNSLDEEYIVKVGWVLQELAKENQVFIFTHNLLLLNTLLEKENESVFYVTKENNLANVDKCKKSDISSLRKLFLDIQSDYNKTLQQNSSGSIPQIYDKMNGYIELFVERKLFENMVCRYRKGIQLRPLETFELNKGAIELINKLVKRINTFGNKHKTEGAPAPHVKDLEADFIDFKKLDDMRK
jgi:predicted ATPase